MASLKDPLRGDHVSCLLRQVLLLLVGAAPLYACFPLSKSGERPRIPEEDLPGLTLLTPGENASFQNPAWSPDGRSLAYDFANPPIGASRDGFPTDAEIYVMDLETGTRRQLTDNDLADVEPDWSPDGREIVFVRSSEQAAYPPPLELMLIGVDSDFEQVLLECPGPCVGPKWSRDGEFIAIGMGEGIWTIRRDGSDLRQVSGEKVTAATYPGWSPDGKRLVYWASLEAISVSQAERADLAVLDLSSGEETVVLSGISPWKPDWSPLGSSILYSDQASPQIQWALFTLDLETGVGRRLIPHDLEYDLFDAVWSPDGNRIAFAYGFESTTSHLYILDLAELGDLTPEPTSGP